jgi:pimeloyl-ACP methyl ester carboxylesterase
MQSTEKKILINGSNVQVREQGAGQTVVLLYGYGGVPSRSEFADQLAKTHRVVTISLPGQQGSDRGHDDLHTPLDWITTTLDAIELAAGAGEGATVDLVAQSVSGMIGGEIAAIAPSWLRSLTLIGPLGMYDEAQPPRNLYAEAPFNRVKLITTRPELYGATYGAPVGSDDAAKHEHDVIAYRADEAMARLMWPFGDIGLKRRLHRIRVPVLLLWGADDALVPPAYAKQFAAPLSGPVRIETVAQAGHLATLDAAETCAAVVLSFLTAKQQVAA